MSVQAEPLVGVRVTGGDGQVAGTIEQIFTDDTDGRPVWARVRAGARDRFVPLGGGRISHDGLAVPFATAQILSGPEISAGRYISAAQAARLRRHFGIAEPDLSGSGRLVLFPRHRLTTFPAGPPTVG